MIQWVHALVLVGLVGTAPFAELWGLLRHPGLESPPVLRRALEAIYETAHFETFG